VTTFTVDSTALFTLVAIAAGVGFLAGLAISLFRGGKTEAKPPKKGLFEVARIWRDKFNGQLWLQIDDKSGSKLDDFLGEDRDQAVKIVDDLANWIERPARPAADIPVAVAAAALVAAEPRPAAMPGENMGQMSTADPNTSGQGAVGTQPPQQAAPIPPTMAQESQAANRPRIDVVKGLRLTLEGDAANKIGKAQNRSIAAQVDEILQEKIKGTALEQKAVRLMELPGKGMVVMVGLEQYDSLDAVPYPEVQAAIRYCVAQWEKRMLG
jgi:hypothetical protein